MKEPEARKHGYRCPDCKIPMEESRGDYYCPVCLIEDELKRIESLKKIRIKGMRNCCNNEKTLFGNIDVMRKTATPAQIAALDAFADATELKFHALVERINLATTTKDFETLVWR